MELRPSKFLPSQLGFRASAGRADKQTDKQDEEDIKTASAPNKTGEEGKKGASLEEKQTRILLPAFRRACWFEGFGAAPVLLL